MYGTSNTPGASLPRTVPDAPVQGFAMRAGFARLQPRRPLFAALGLALLLAGLLTTYQIALARVPHERAAIEKVLRAYTGLDLRFAALELRWGWYGPEAVFSQVELREPASSGVRMHAQRLTVGFSSWSSLRRGQLEISRITLVAPDIDLSAIAGPPAALPARGATVALQAKMLDPHLLELLERAPLGHIVIEEGTLRLRDARYGAVPVVLRVNRAQLSRSVDALVASALVYLPERLGQSAFVALRLEGDLARPAQLAGNVRLIGRRLAFGPLGEWLAHASAHPELALARAGVGDVTLDLNIARGDVSRGEGEVAIGGLALRTAEGTPLAAATHSWERARADLAFSRGDGALRIEARRLTLARRGEPTAQGALTLEWNGAADALHVTLETLPAVALIDAAAAIPALRSFAALDELEVGGQARHAQLNWDGSAAPGRQWSVNADLSDLDVNAPRVGWRLAHVGATLQGSESELRASLSGQAVTFASTALADEVTGVAIDGELRLAQARDGWSVAGEGVHLVLPDAELRVTGRLSGAAASLRAAARPQFELQIALSKLDRSALERIFPSRDSHAPFAAVAALVQSGDVTDGQIRLRGRLEANALPHVLDTRGELAVRNLTLFGEQRWPAAQDIDGHFSWVNERARIVVDHGTVAGLTLSEGTAEWLAGTTPRISARAYGPLANAVGWLRDHPDALTLAADIAQLEASGDVLVDFALAPARAGKPAPRWRLAAFVDRATLTAAGVQPLTDLSGTWLIDSGELRPSRVRGRWVGGPVALNFSQTHTGQRAIHVRVEGTADGAALAPLLASDPAHSLAGRFDWHAELRHDLADDGAKGWRIDGESNLLGLVSNLPAPLAKAAHEALPARLQLLPMPQGQADLTMRLGDRLAVRLELSAANQGRRSISRGAVRIGDADAVLPAEPVMSASGRLDELDVAGWLAAWPQLRAAQAGPEPLLPEVKVELAADAMVLGAERLPDAQLIGTLSADALDLRVASRRLAGSVHWPGKAARAHPAEVRLERALLQASDAQPLGVLLAGLSGAQAVRIEIDDLSFAALRLGRVAATLTAAGGQVEISDFSARRPAQDLTATGSCERAAQTCRVRFALASRDLAATLADFQLAPQLTAAEAQLSGELTLPLGGARPWLAAVHGELHMEVGEGALAAAADLPLRAVPGFALFGVTPLLVAGRVSPSFASLDASFALRDGQASTEDLRLAAPDAQVLMRGRIGLIERAYDQSGVILRAGDRLTDTVQRLAGPRMAAAWLALRSAVGSGRADPQTQSFHLRGSWDAPSIEP